MSWVFCFSLLFVAAADLKVFNILFKDRVTKPQKKMLITLLRETKYMEGKKEKEWYWEKIQAALNTIGPKKTIIQWKKCWRDMRLTTRKKLAELKRCQLAGGSPPPGIELNQEDNDIIDIVGAEYFYEEMNGELKPENFMPNFDYVPEHFCDAILTAAGQQQATATHMQTQINKDQQHSVHQQQQQQQQQQGTQQPSTDHHANEGEANEAASSSNHNDGHGTSVFQSTPNVGSMGAHNQGGGELQGIHMSQHASALHGSLHPHLLRRQQQHHAVAAVAFQRENMFEEKLLQLMQDVFPTKRNKRRKCRDPDKLFLLSLYDEMKRIPDEARLDAKSELMQVLKKYQKKSASIVKQEKSSQLKQNVGENLPTHSSGMAAHSMYQLSTASNVTNKCDNEPHSPQSQHSLDANVSVAVHAPQQLPHALFQLQKKYDDSVVLDKQNEQQRKQAEAVAAAAAVHHQQQQQQQQQQQTPSTNEQQTHMHHAQMPHNIMFPLPQQLQRPEQSSTQAQQQPAQHSHAHNPHQQQQQTVQHAPHPQQQQPPHHTPTIFGAGAATDRPTMAYENVG